MWFGGYSFLKSCSHKTTMLSLYNISGELPPYSSRLFKATSYHALKLISTSRFRVRLNLILINCTFKHLRCWEKGKRILISAGLWGSQRNSNSQWDQGLSLLSNIPQLWDSTSIITPQPTALLGCAWAHFATSHTTDIAIFNSCSQTGFKEKYDVSKHLSKITLFKMTVNLFQMQGWMKHENCPHESKC